VPARSVAVAVSAAPKGEYVVLASRCAAEPVGGRITSRLVLLLILGCQ
jgi:hypothetical protein